MLHDDTTRQYQIVKSRTKHRVINGLRTYIKHMRKHSIDTTHWRAYIAHEDRELLDRPVQAFEFVVV